MIHDRVKIMVEIEVNLDSVPGWGDNSQDFVNSLSRMVTDSWIHYHPVVKVDHIESLFMVTYGGPEDEKTWVFVDHQAAVDKHMDLINSFAEGKKT